MSRILLDTHTFIWVAQKSPDLSRSAQQILSLRSTEPYVSVVSLWEIAIKIERGTFRFDDPLEEVIRREFETNGYVRVELEDRHLTELLRLPHKDTAHGDPFDRMLAAQARAENLEILSVDAKLDAYGVQRVW